MGSKFLLMMLLAKYFSTEDVGLYGLILSFVNISVLIIGLDYYTFSQQELSKGQEINIIISNQLILHVIMYILFFFVTFLFVNDDKIGISYFLIVYFILFFEHLNQEISRYLIFYERQLAVSLFLFLRTGVWAIIYAVYAYYFESFNLISLFIFWLIFSLIALISSLIYLINRHKFNISFCAINFKYILSGISKSIYIFIAGLAFKAIFFADRFLLKDISDINIVGVYVFYMTLVMSALSFYEPMVISFSYQKMLKYFNAKTYDKYKKEVKKASFQTTLFIFFLIVGFYFFIPIVLSILDKESYISFLWIMKYIYVIMVFYVFSLFLHYLLYSIDCNKYILYSHLSSLVVFFISYIFFEFFTISNGLSVVLISICLCFIWMVISSLFYFFNKIKFIL